MSAVFVPVIILAEALGIGVVVLMSVYVAQIGGLTLNFGQPSIFNLHPFLMTFGLGFLYGNAVLVFKTGARTGFSKLTRKATHFCIQLTAFLLAVVGLFAVFRYHNIKGFPNMKSLHSWVGMTTVILFGSQLLLGFLFFVYPQPRETIKASFLKFHVFLGSFITCLVVVSMLTGLTEHRLFNGGFKELTPVVLTANCFALLLLLFMGAVTYIVTSSWETPEGGSNEEQSALLEMEK